MACCFVTTFQLIKVWVVHHWHQWSLMTGVVNGSSDLRSVLSGVSHALCTGGSRALHVTPMTRDLQLEALRMACEGMLESEGMTMTP